MTLAFPTKRYVGETGIRLIDNGVETLTNICFLAGKPEQDAGAETTATGREVLPKTSETRLIEVRVPADSVNSARVQRLLNGKVQGLKFQIAEQEEIVAPDDGITLFATANTRLPLTTVHQIIGRFRHEPA